MTPDFWRKVPDTHRALDFGDRYLVGRNGVVVSMARGATPRKLKPGRTQAGVLQVRLYCRRRDTGESYDLPVTLATLVALTFLPKPDPTKHMVVRHEDGDKSNCRVGNLVWVEETPPSERTLSRWLGGRQRVLANRRWGDLGMAGWGLRDASR